MDLAKKLALAAMSSDPNSRLSGAEKIIEEATRVSDVESLFLGKTLFAKAMSQLGHPERMMTVFSECLSMFEEQGQLESWHDAFLSAFKWVLHRSTTFPAISRSQIAALNDQFAELAKRYEYGTRAITYLKMCQAAEMGELEELPELLDALAQISRDKLADCHACEQNTLVEHSVTGGHFEKSLEFADPILNGSMKCGSVPHITYGWCLRGLTERADFKKAETYQKMGYDLIKSEAGYLGELAPHLSYLVFKKNWEAAVKLLNRHLPWTINSYQTLFCLRFFHATRYLLDECPRDSLKLRLPEEVVIDKVDQVSGFSEYMDQQIETISRKFDVRNGNDYSSEGMRKIYRFAAAE